MDWLEMPANRPTDATTYWIRTWWFVSPFQAVWNDTDAQWDVPGWANPLPWWVCRAYREV